MIIFSVNGFESPVKIQNLSHWVKNKMQKYSIYKRNTLNVWTHVVWK